MTLQADLIKATIQATTKIVEAVCHAKSILRGRSMDQGERMNKLNDLQTYQASILKRVEQIDIGYVFDIKDVDLILLNIVND